MKIRRMNLLAACLMLQFAVGCTLYTVRVNGPQQNSTVIPSQASFSDIVKTFGAPDVIHQMGAGSSICIYHSLNYQNYLSLYAESHKEDLVLTFVGDRLTESRWVSRGQTMSIIGGQNYDLGLNAGD